MGLTSPDPLDAIILNEVQLILAEKRTSLAVMRTGIAVFVLPLSVFSILIATSKYYNVFNIIYLFMPLLLINVGLIVLGSYLIIRSIKKIHGYDKSIEMLKQKHVLLSEFID
jgi:hypothetical protein